MDERHDDSFEESSEELENELVDDIADTSLRTRWEEHQRDLLTHPMDFSIDALVRLVDNHELDLNPTYERRDRWDIERKSRLIESFLLNIPVPSVYLNEDHYGLYSVIDGKQRISAIVGFLHDEYELSGLSILREANGHKFSDLDSAMQRALRARGTVRAVILNHISDPTMKYEVFSRINTGGVPLNAQELRNAAFPGPFNSLIQELSQTPPFQLTLGDNLAIWREMGDVELVLRYFTLIDQPSRYLGVMSHALSETLQRKNDETPEELERDRVEFVHAVDKCRAAFGEMVYRRWHAEATNPSRRISVAVYDAQMLAVRDFDVSTLAEHATAIQARMKELFADGDFTSSLRLGGASRYSLERRVQIVRRVLASSVGIDA